MRRQGSFRQNAKCQLDSSIHAGRSLAARHGGVLPAYERLLWHVQTPTTLLHPSDRPGDNCNGVNAGLLALALYHGDWLRPVESWHPVKQNAWPQFSLLAQHLLARYPVPLFMTSAWFDLPPGEKLPQHLGRGENIRTAKLPVKLTKAMAHLFTQAPHHYSAVQAIRWEQVRGLGGSKVLTRAVVGTRLGKVLENEDFWESVLHFFINHPSLDLAQVGPVVDFLQHQRFEWKEGVSQNGVFGRLPPPRPDFTMKGRTVASIVRQVEEWHKELGREENQPTITWRPASFKEFRLVQGEEELGNMRVWTITKYRRAGRCFLRDRQCGIAWRRTRSAASAVRSRSGPCKSKRAWPATSFDHRSGHSEEGNLPGSGKCNRLPSANERAVVEQWAAVEGLKVGEAFHM